MKNKERHEYWMEIAIREAGLALARKEVPVGAVIVRDGIIIGKGSNQIEMLQDPTAHAEMIALSAAANYLKSRRFEKTEIYVTLEPCPMCAGAFVLANILILGVGAYDSKAGALHPFSITSNKHIEEFTEQFDQVLHPLTWPEK